MARSTHEKQLERARAKRLREADVRRRATSVVVAIVAVLVIGVLVLAGGLLIARGGGDEADGGAGSVDRAEADEAAVAPDETTDTAVGAAACPAHGDDVPTPIVTPYDQRPSADLEGASTVTATVQTTCGEVVMALDAAAAPATVANFVALAEDGYYIGTPFHRVIDGFMVQGGDPTGTGAGCVDEACSAQLPGYTFGDELELAEQLVGSEGGYPRGAVAMANRGPDTNGSQFFIVQADPTYPLPPAYAIFGEVVEGMDVVDRIAAGPVEGDQAIDPAVVIGVDVERCGPEDC